MIAFPVSEVKKFRRLTAGKTPAWNTGRRAILVIVRASEAANIFLFHRKGAKIGVQGWAEIPGHPCSNSSNILDCPAVVSYNRGMKPENRVTETILDSIADGVFTIDADGRITSFNRAAQEITGFSRSDAIGQFCFDIFRANICQTA